MRAKWDWQFYVSAAVLVGIVATGIIAMVASDDGPTSNVPNYYFRAEGVQERLDPPALEQNRRTVIEAWHLDDKWRWQLWEMEGEELVEVSEVVVKRDTAYSYDPSLNTYFSEKVPDAQAFSLFLGVGFIPAESIADFIELQADSDGYQGWKSKGTATLLGRDVQLIEIQTHLGGLGRPFEAFDVRMTYWIEPEVMLVLARDLELPGGKQRFEIVELSVGEPIDEESVVFTPPADAELVDPPPFSPANLARVRDNDPDVPSGFLTPEHLPAGYELASRETENLSNEEPTTLALTFEAGTLANGAIQEIEIEQTEAVGDLPAWTQGALQVNLDGHDAYALELDYSRQITWIQDGLQILIRANDIPIAELLLIGESLR